MTYTRPQRYTIYAEEQRENELFDVAGVYYTAASHGWLMQFHYLPEDLPESENIPASSPQQLGRAIQDLLSAILCFRLAGELDRGRNHSKRGVLLVEDLLDHEDGFKSDNPRKGLLYEMLGDLYLFGNLDSPNEAYLTAGEYYESADSPRGWQAEPEFDSLIRLLIDLADSLNYDLDEKTRRDILHQSLIARIEYKRNHYGKILDEVLAIGKW